jgi:hypothetical protein
MTSYLEHRRALKLGQVQPGKKPRKKIKPFSDKRAKLNRQYSKESRPRWKGKPCRVKSPACTGISQGIHHIEGKDTPDKLLDPDNQIECCNACNLFLEVNDAWARNHGFKKSRMKTKRFNK